MGGKCDFALCLETLSIHKIALTVYSIKTPVRITGFEVRWMVFGEINSKCMTCSYKFIYEQRHMKKVHSGLNIYQFTFV